MGYDVKNRKLVANDDEARIVVEIYRRYLARKSVHALRDALADVTSEAPQWHHRQQGKIPDGANRPLSQHGTVTLQSPPKSTPFCDEN